MVRSTSSRWSVKYPASLAALGQGDDGLDAYAEQVVDDDIIVYGLHPRRALSHRPYDLVPFLSDNVAEHRLVTAVSKIGFTRKGCEGSKSSFVLLMN
jgi:hypothetical protein